MSQLTICLIIFAVTIIGYCSGAYSLATIAITSLMAFTLTGCLTAKDALACFSNGNVIMIARLPLLIITMLYCIFVAVRLAPDEPSAELSVMGKKKAGAAPKYVSGGSRNYYLLCGCSRNDVCVKSRSCSVAGDGDRRAGYGAVRCSETEGGKRSDSVKHAASDRRCPWNFQRIEHDRSR